MAADDVQINGEVIGVLKEKGESFINYIDHKPIDHVLNKTAIHSSLN